LSDAPPVEGCSVVPALLFAFTPPVASFPPALAPPFAVTPPPAFEAAPPLAAPFELPDPQSSTAAEANKNKNLDAPRGISGLPGAAGCEHAVVEWWRGIGGCMDLWKKVGGLSEPPTRMR